MMCTYNVVFSFNNFFLLSTAWLSFYNVQQNQQSANDVIKYLFERILQPRTVNRFQNGVKPNAIKEDKHSHIRGSKKP